MFSKKLCFRVRDKSSVGEEEFQKKQGASYGSGVGGGLLICWSP